MEPVREKERERGRERERERERVGVGWRRENNIKKIQTQLANNKIQLLQYYIFNLYPPVSR